MPGPRGVAPRLDAPTLDAGAESLEPIPQVAFARVALVAAEHGGEDDTALRVQVRSPRGHVIEREAPWYI